MKLLFFLIVNSAISFSGMLWAQKIPMTDTTKSIYKNLPTFKAYAVSSSSMTSADTSWFKINDKNVDEATYRKFGQTFDVYDKCRPCILLSFDINENLLSKRIAYSECQVGYRIEYYINGTVKTIGHYKENATGNWDNLLERGYCREDGVWTYFNTKGIITRTEIWKEGKLIKKVIVKKK